MKTKVMLHPLKKNVVHLTFLDDDETRLSTMSLEDAMILKAQLTIELLGVVCPRCFGSSVFHRVKPGSKGIPVCVYCDNSGIRKG